MAKRQQHKEVTLARNLAYALGKAPAEFGLVPDEEGWVGIKDLIKAFAQEEGLRGVRESMVMDAASRLAPDELELEGKRVRARQRTYERPRYGEEPPAHIFIGVRRKAWPALSRRGLDSGPDRPSWVLSSNKELAQKLGERRDNEAVLITVQAARAMEMGTVFAGWGEELYLADWIAADCLMGPPIDEKLFPPKKPSKSKKEDQAPKMPALDQMPGSFVLNMDEDEKPYKRKGIKKEISWKNERRKGSRKKRDTEY